MEDHHFHSENLELGHVPVRKLLNCQGVRYLFNKMTRADAISCLEKRCLGRPKIYHHVIVIYCKKIVGDPSFCNELWSWHPNSHCELQSWFSLAEMPGGRIQPDAFAMGSADLRGQSPKFTQSMFRYVGFMLAGGKPDKTFHCLLGWDWVGWGVGGWGGRLSSCSNAFYLHATLPRSSRALAHYLHATLPRSSLAIANYLHAMLTRSSLALANYLHATLARSSLALANYLYATLTRSSLALANMEKIKKGSYLVTDGARACPPCQRHTS